MNMAMPLVVLITNCPDLVCAGRGRDAKQQRNLHSRDFSFPLWEFGQDIVGECVPCLRFTKDGRAAVH